MSANQVRILLRTAPFQPFALRLADGQAIVVNHPEMILFAPSGRTAIIYQPDDSFSIVDMELVTALESKTNGRGRRARA